MKLEEGMYIRVQNDVENVVVINRIANIFDNTILTENDGSIYQGEYTKENIIKASHNIIDLIEVGDYVNGYCVEEKQDKFLIIDSKDNWCWGEGIMPIEEIKSIVTKEQFKSMQYEVNGNE